MELDISLLFSIQYTQCNNTQFYAFGRKHSKHKSHIKVTFGYKCSQKQDCNSKYMSFLLPFIK